MTNITINSKSHRLPPLFEDLKAGTWFSFRGDYHNMSNPPVYLKLLCREFVLVTGESRRVSTDMKGHAVVTFKADIKLTEM